MYDEQKEVDEDHEEVMFSSKLSFLDLSGSTLSEWERRVKRI